MGAAEVKRGLRFCMKVHRFREMCRPGSCIDVRKVRVVSLIAPGGISVVVVRAGIARGGQAWEDGGGVLMIAYATVVDR